MEKEVNRDYDYMVKGEVLHALKLLRHRWCGIAATLSETHGQSDPARGAFALCERELYALLAKHNVARD